jgi:hypothetical protein
VTVATLASLYDHLTGVMARVFCEIVIINEAEKVPAGAVQFLLAPYSSTASWVRGFGAVRRAHGRTLSCANHSPFTKGPEAS